MYLRYYNLKEQPFRITADPKFIWLGKKHQEALAVLQYGVVDEKGFLMLTGEVGTGKTLLINCLLKLLESDVVVATVPNPGLDPLDLFNVIAQEYKMKQRFKTKAAFLNEFKKFLQKNYASNKKTFLIIDEAQRLNDDMLEEIRLLSNIERSDTKLINIFLVGQPELDITLQKSQNRALRQRISIKHNIEPLSLIETHEYIRHRLKVAGAKNKVISKDAINQVYQVTNGLPRLINIVCDRALLTGFTNDKKSIRKDIIDECARELKADSKPKKIIADIETTQKNDLKENLLSAIFKIKGDESKPPFERWLWLLSGIFAFMLILFAGLMIVTGSYYMTRMESEVLQRQLKDEKYTASLDKQKEMPKNAIVNNNSSAKIDTKKKGTSGVQGVTTNNSSSSSAEKGEQEIDSLVEDQKTHENREEDTKSNNAEQLFDQKLIITFKHNSNEFAAGEFDKLKILAEHLLKNENIKINVNGYTDASGSESYNISVSSFRASNVKSYLIGKGINPERIIAKGRGSQDPLFPNTTSTNRSKNRRVEISFKKGE